jgi:hypothetical protein
MKNQKFVIFVIFLIVQLSTHIHAEDLNNEEGTILTSAESLFKSMQKKDYAQIWRSLSQESRDTIVQDTYKALNPNSGVYSEESLGKDFTTGGSLSTAYWNAFLQKFDPMMVLEQSRWEMESIKSDKAEIRIIYKKAQSPAFLKMFKEDGLWKAGLVESFWTRKR